MSVAQGPRPRRAARTDDALLRALAEGDLSALGELYDRHAASMWRTVERTLGTRTDAEDVVHTTFLKLPQIARAYDGRSDARSWLVGIAVHVALRHRRGAGRFLRMLSWFSQIVGPPATSSPEARASGRQELIYFESAFRKLSPKKRAVFALIELEGLTMEETSRALGVPSSTVRTRLHHARRHLHEAMKKGGW